MDIHNLKHAQKFLFDFQFFTKQIFCTRFNIKTMILIFLIFFTENLFCQKMLTPNPPMGWNSWNWFGKKEVNEKVIKECIDAIVAEGLKDAGYKYIIIDGGWRDTKLGNNGELLPHPTKFPGGIKVLADYAHSMGLKFGLHTVPGTHDCAGDPVGGMGIETVHIQQFVDWGIDFIKLDLCRNSNGWNEELIKTTYFKWKNLIDKCGRDIVLNISAYEYRSWYPEVCQMARTTGDIGAKVAKGALFDADDTGRKHFLSVLTVANQNNMHYKFAGNGYWNDPDMMVTGNHGLTFEEQKAHFALWCLMSSPLFLGNDPRNMTKEEKDIVLNKDAIKVNQYPSGQGYKTEDKGNIQVWVKKLENLNMAVLIINRSKTDINSYNLNLKQFCPNRKLEIKNIFSGQYLKYSKHNLPITLKPSSCIFLTIKNK